MREGFRVVTLHGAMQSVTACLLGESLQFAHSSGDFRPSVQQVRVRAARPGAYCVKKFYLEEEDGRVRRGRKSLTGFSGVKSRLSDRTTSVPS